MGEGERRCTSGEDRISALPDELLHEILVRLRCAYAAARTSVLSRRWRHVWTHLPELLLDVSPASLDTVDAALAGYSAPTLERLRISVSSNFNTFIGARRIAPWLHFAAEHVVGELYLHVPQWFLVIDPKSELELPACERAKRIELSIQYGYTKWLRLQVSGGLFAALTSLKICRFRMDGSDLTALVCTQCPCLRDLNLCIQLIAFSDVFVHSNSLHALELCVFHTRRLEVVAPRLEELSMHSQSEEAHISAPKLAKVAWHAHYDPHVNRFVDVGRTLRRLETCKWASSLTKRFDEVDELELEIDLQTSHNVVARYESFLNETNKLPKCKSFSITLSWEHHAFVPIMLRLLRCCNATKKFRVLFGGWSRPEMFSCPLSCPCRLEKSHKMDGIDLSSLEEVEIKGFSHSHEQMELVKFLSYSAGILKRLVIISAWCFPTPNELRERVRSMCHPNVKVEFVEGQQIPLG